MNILGRCCFLGKAGYNYHSRGFFTALDKLATVAIDNWSGDNDPYYLTKDQHDMLSRFRMLNQHNYDVEIFLHSTDHPDWYNKTPTGKLKIAYNVWESTRQPDGFFNKLMSFDHIWVPSNWQRDCTIEQGAPPEKVFVVPEGIDANRFKPSPSSGVTAKFANPDKFTFTVIGRWEYRKATDEIIKAFIRAFGHNDEVELLLLVDNPFDHKKESTEVKLSNMGIAAHNIKILHHIAENDYDILLRETDCFVSCSRSEGWNLPLMEAMACGIPTICTGYSAETEFCCGISYEVGIKGYEPAKSDTGDFPGQYAIPDFDNLSVTMEYVRDHYNEARDRAILGSERIRNKYTWDNAAYIARALIEAQQSKDAIAATYKTEAKAHHKQVGGIVVIDCYPNSQEKIDKLCDNIANVRNSTDAKIAIISHFPLSEKIFEEVDYYIYDAENSLPEYCLPIYYNFAEARVTGRLDRPYHALPIVKTLQNVCKLFCDAPWIHFIEYDINVDFDKHFAKVNSTDKQFVGYVYENGGVHTNIMSFKPDFMYTIVKDINDWGSYKRAVPRVESNLILEYWMRLCIGKQNLHNSAQIFDITDINMRRDSFKQLPEYNIVCSETDDDKYIVFFIYPSQNRPLSVSMKDDNGSDLVISDLYERFCFTTVSKNTESVTVSIPGVYARKATLADMAKDGDFIFHDGSIKCGKKKSKSAVSIKNYYIDGAFAEVNGDDDGSDKLYNIKFIDNSTGQIVFAKDVPINNWCKTDRKYYTNWNTKITCDGELIYDRLIDLKGQRVFIVLDSKALGDTISWMPYVEAFRQKHDANVIAITFHNNLFRDTYPNIEFVQPGSGVPNIMAQYNIGCYDNDLGRNKFNWRITPLQKVASDILGLKYEEIRPLISYKKYDRPIKEKYVAISEHSTFQCKYWLYPGGWQTVIEYLNKRGYKVAVISREATSLQNIINLTNKPLDQSISTISHADLFIGVSSGPTWMAWSLDIPTILISGYSAEWAEMKEGPKLSRVINKDVCHGCFNDPSLPLARGDWNWCPRNRNFECSKQIDPEMVISEIDRLLD